MVKVAISKVLLPDEAPAEGDYGPGPFVGVVARATLTFPQGSAAIIATLDSPGLWNVDEPSAQGAYGDEIFAEERDTLVNMLCALRDWRGEYTCPAGG